MFNDYSQNDIKEPTGGFKSKVHVLDNLLKECRRYKMGVGFKTNKRLQTYNPHNNINYWPYKPQGDFDKAPTR